MGCSTFVCKMQTVIIDSQYTISIYNHLHLKASRPLSIWSTTTHIIWVMNDVCPSYFGASDRQLPVYTFITLPLTYMACLPDLFESSSFSSISMTYHTQFSKSPPFEAGQSRELCSWTHGFMQHDRCHWSRFAFRIACSCHDLYGINDLNFVSKFFL